MGFNIRSIWQSMFGSVTVAKAENMPREDVDFRFFGIDDMYAMNVSAVYSAVKLISEGVARLPLLSQRYNSALRCYVNDFDGTLFSVLRVAPNTDMTAFDLWRSAVQQILLQGFACLVPKRDVEGNVTELVLLSPGSVSPDSRGRIFNVTDSVNGIYGVYSLSELVYLRNIGLDGGHTGMSTVGQMGEALGIIRLSDHNTATTLSNGGRMRGLLSGDTGVNTFGAPTQQQLGDVSAQVERDIREGRTVIPVPPEMKFQPIALSPADAKVLESKQVTIRDVARFFRVHPDLLYEGSNNTYKAAEVPNVMFLSQTLEQLLVQIENELLVKLVPRPLWGRRRIRFDREALYATDLLTEAAYYEKMLQTGVYTINELRRRKGQPPVPGGDTPLVSANLKGVDAIVNETKQISNE